MIESYVRNVIEASLLAAGRALSLQDLRALFDEPTRPDDAALAAALEQLSGEYAERGIELKQTASGWRIQVRREFAAEVSRLWPERPARYSRALLETLALIAYRQPITRGEIEEVRGVAVNPNIIKTLLERNWIRVVGQRDVPGRPELLGTTREFLDYFGLRSLDELPPLSELKALSELNLQLDLPPGAAAQQDGAAEADGGEPQSGPPRAEPGEAQPEAESEAEASEGVGGCPSAEESDGPVGAASSAMQPHTDPPDEPEQLPSRRVLAVSDGERG